MLPHRLPDQRQHAIFQMASVIARTALAGSSGIPDSGSCAEPCANDAGTLETLVCILLYSPLRDSGDSFPILPFLALLIPDANRVRLCRVVCRLLRVVAVAAVAEWVIHNVHFLSSICFLSSSGRELSLSCAASFALLRDGNLLYPPLLPASG